MIIYLHGKKCTHSLSHFKMTHRARYPRCEEKYATNLKIQEAEGLSGVNPDRLPDRMKNKRVQFRCNGQIAVIREGPGW